VAQRNAIAIWSPLLVFFPFSVNLLHERVCNSAVLIKLVKNTLVKVRFSTSLPNKA
jgi:hypothetical protein